MSTKKTARTIITKKQVEDDATRQIKDQEPVVVVDGDIAEDPEDEGSSSDDTEVPEWQQALLGQLNRKAKKDYCKDVRFSISSLQKTLSELEVLDSEDDAMEKFREIYRKLKQKKDDKINESQNDTAFEVFGEMGKKVKHLQLKEKEEELKNLTKNWVTTDEKVEALKDCLTALGQVPISLYVKKSKDKSSYSDNAIKLFETFLKALPEDYRPK